ncbi:hypothetical protein B7494_g6415 [Chlorociboria aeruginascens]|nr:hypothetical protein B7494_g6415 [Chlorociboria aeruginascens]
MAGFLGHMSTATYPSLNHSSDNRPFPSLHQHTPHPPFHPSFPIDHDLTSCSLPSSGLISNAITPIHSSSGLISNAITPIHSSSGLISNAITPTHSSSRGDDEIPETMNIDANISLSSLPLPAVLPLEEIVVAFQNLDDHSRDLATLLVFLGEADIPVMMLRRAAWPKKIFDLSGIINLVPAPYINPLLSQPENLNSTLKQLESLSLIAFTWDETIRVQPDLRWIIEHGFGETRRDMEYEASLLVFHAFPTNVNLETGRALRVDRICSVQLPHVQHVLRYFDNPHFIDRFTPQEREQIILSCLLSSFFGPLAGKWKVLEVTEKIVGIHDADSLLWERLQFRRIVMHRLYNFTGPEEVPIYRTSHALAGEMILFRAQLLIYQDQLPLAWQELALWNPRQPETPEQGYIRQMKVSLQVRICRFAGNYLHAKQLLHKLEGEGLCNGIEHHYFADYISVYGETGEVELAARAIPSGNFLEEGLGLTGLRVSHVAASTYLLRGLWMLKRMDGVDLLELDRADFHLKRAKAIYRALEEKYPHPTAVSLVGSIRHFSIVAGLAMVAHVESRFFPEVSTYEEALSYWKIALSEGRSLIEKLGGKSDGSFLEMIISYSMCDLTNQLGLREGAIKLMEKTKLFYRITGRQFQYVALGGVWFDLVQRWISWGGLTPISDMNFHFYVVEQRKSRFPVTKNTIKRVERGLGTLTDPNLQGPSARTTPNLQGRGALTVPTLRGLDTLTVPDLQGHGTLTIPGLQGWGA